MAGRWVFLFLALALPLLPTSGRELADLYDHDGCTAIIVGRQASADGSTLTTHTNDCKNCDFRLARVPAKDHLPGSQRPIAPVRFDYPRFVGDARGEVFTEDKVDKSVYQWKPTEAIGFIPQVNHTYSYIDGVYGIQNEKGLSFGESTCGGKLVAFPVFDGGHALFDLSELTRIALERCETARCAIKTMGDLGVEYGFYGTVWTGGVIANFEAGEALTIADGKETWVFHICPDDTGKSAVWVAQRVQEGHVSVVANMFTIRTFNVSDTDNVMASENVFEVAQRAKLWDPANGDLDFVLTYGFPIPPGADLYFYRRVWRVFDYSAPSLHLDADLKYTPNGGGLPFSIKPDRPLTVKDIFNLNRDHFEGTRYDLTKGLAGGPYGNPNRYDKYTVGEVSKEDLRLGHYERPISMFRTSYSTVVQARQWLPSVIGSRTWFGSAQPHATAYVPFYAGTIREPIPEQWSHGSLYKFTHKAMFWCVDLLSNWAERMYLPMIPDIQAAQAEVEELAFTFASEAETKAYQLLSEGYELEAENVLATFSTNHAEKIFTRWWELVEHLITKFHDGFRLDDFHAMTIADVMTAVWYPRFWLASTGYWPDGDPHPVNGTSSVGSTPPISAPTSNDPYHSSRPDIVPAAQPESNSTRPTTAAAISLPCSAPSGVSLVTLVCGVVLGMGLGYFIAKREKKYEGYVPIGDME